VSTSAVVLLSGGLDSMVCAGLAREAGYEVIALTVDYGQRHRIELEAAAAIAARLAARHVVLKLDLRAFGGSALTDDIAVPKDGGGEGIPVTYVPARNTVLLALALAHAEVTGSDAIFAGVNAVDYSGYPDCRPEFLDAFERLANLATRRAVEGAPISIEAPIVSMRKAQIVRTGFELGVDFSLTVSCYNADAEGRACGRCDACRFRSQGFVEAGIEDPTRYQPGAPRRSEGTVRG